MSNHLKCVLLSGLIVAIAGPASAQLFGPDAVDATGGSKKVAGITHEYAIGQVMSGETHLSGLLVVTPGVLQPTARARIPEFQIEASELQLFPNPVEATLSLQPAFRRGGTLTYELYDVSGKLILARKAELADGIERQDMQVGHLAAGQYFLKVSWVAGRATPRTSGYKIQKLR